MSQTIESQMYMHRKAESVGSFDYQQVNQSSTYTSEPKLFIADTHPQDKFVG